MEEIIEEAKILANKGIIDSFITSQPSRMLKTFMNLSSKSRKNQI